MESINIIVQTSDWLEIGTIVAPHGLRGELKVASSTDFPQRFEQPGLRWLQSPNNSSPQPVELLKGRYVPGKNQYVIQLLGIENRESAEALQGYKLLVPQSDRLPLSEDEYHVSDLINLEVYHQQTGLAIGVVTDILWAGNELLQVKLYQQNIAEETAISQDTSLIQAEQKQPTAVLIPFVKEIVPVVDLDRKRLEINPPAGLLELS